MYLKSKRGDVRHIDEWKQIEEEFWNIFEKARKCPIIGHRIPIRPKDSWERNVKILGLEVVEI